MNLTNSVLSAASEHPVYVPDHCINRRQRRYVMPDTHYNSFDYSFV